MSKEFNSSEATPCKGAVNYSINPQEKTVVCRFAALTQGSICAACPWSRLCEQLFQQTVTVIAFSGMNIGTFPIFKESKTTIEIQTQRGQLLIFDKKSKLQTNAKDPKFANRLA